MAYAELFSGSTGPLDLHHLRHFVVLAETLHFHRAAERLHLAQPSLSRSIRTLEEDLGTSLFLRSQREVRLTSAGAALLPEARLLLAQATRTQHLIQDIVRGDAGLLRIGFISSTAITLLPFLLRAFRAVHPRVRLELQEMSSAAQTRALLAGQIDLALIRDMEAVPDIQQHSLLKERLLLLVPSGHALVEQVPVTFSRLVDVDIVLLRREVAPGSYDRIWANCLAHGLEPHIFTELADSNAVFSMVAAGLAVSFLFSSFAQAARPGVTFLPLQDEMADSEVSLAWQNQAAQQSPALQSFIHLAQSAFPLLDNASGHISKGR